VREPGRGTPGPAGVADAPGVASRLLRSHADMNAPCGGDAWAMILAGGEGVRLRPLTRRIAGDDRPKQFCPLLGGETLLARTRRRAALAVSPRRTVFLLTESHEPFYAPLLADVPPERLVVQPSGRGTAPAILYGLLRIAERGGDDPVAMLPSDHYVSDDARFMEHVEAAFAAVRLRPELIILLGIQADRPEPQYGWIEPAGRPLLECGGHPVHRVRRFWEKPPPALAERLLDRACLWNSFVVVGRVPALLALIRASAPALEGAFAAAWRRRAVDGAGDAVRQLYRELAPADFSADVLAARPASLAVLAVRGVDWCDWGEPGRVRRTLARLGGRRASPEPRAAAAARTDRSA
jgi:mannose-1-phosphate guanylyltransferase